MALVARSQKRIEKYKAQIIIEQEESRQRIRKLQLKIEFETARMNELL